TGTPREVTPLAARLAAGAHSAFARARFARRRACRHGVALLKKRPGWLTSGKNKDNQEARAAHRPPLLQEADAAQVRETLAQLPRAASRASVDRRPRRFERPSRLLERQLIARARRACQRMR